MKRFSSTTLKTAFVKSIPIFCSYVFVSMAYGMMMASAGFPWYDSLLVSLTVYTGAFQFVLITFLSSGASLITIALTALLMNSRQSFYSITFLKEFKQMGRRKLYLRSSEKRKRGHHVPRRSVQPLLLDSWFGSWRHFRPDRSI